MTAVHVHAPAPDSARVVRGTCATCERTVSIYVLTYEWYGPDCTCLRCGERWSDGELIERPFARGWRQRSIDSAIRSAKRHGITIDPRTAVAPKKKSR